jgi:hypothetical protein
MWNQGYAIWTKYAGRASPLQEAGDFTSPFVDKFTVCVRLSSLYTTPSPPKMRLTVSLKVEKKHVRMWAKQSLR